MSAHCYRVVEEELGPRYASALYGMTVSAHDDRTEITGPPGASSNLHGRVERIAGLGLTLHSLTPLIPRTRGLMRRRMPNQPGSSTTTLARAWARNSRRWFTTFTLGTAIRVMRAASSGAALVRELAK